MVRNARSANAVICWRELVCSTLVEAQPVGALEGRDQAQTMEYSQSDQQ
jgi:hypothetical protein